MAVLLIAEINDGALALDATSKAVTAAAKLGLAPGDCLVIEDALSGIQAAKAA